MFMMFKIGWRNLWRNKRRSLIMLGALIVGIWGLVMMYATNRGWMLGMVNMSVESHTAHIQVHAKGYNDDPKIQTMIKDPAPLVGKIKAVEHVTGVSPRAKIRGLLSTARGSNGITLVGIDPAMEAAVSTIDDKIVDGRYFDESDKKGILIGKSLAEKLKVKPSRKVVVYARGTDKELSPLGLKVTGTFDTGNEAVDKYMAFVPLSYFQDRLEMGGGVHEIAVLVDDEQNLEAARTGVSGALAGRGGLEVFTWRQKLSFIYNILDMMNMTNYVILGIVVVAISLGVANTIVMSVFERFREIGIMRAVGTTPLQIFTMVIVESASLAVTGLALGSAMAYLSLAIWSAHGLDLSAWADTLSAYGSPSVIYPEVYLQDWVVTWITVVVLAMGSSLYPAVKAARKNPVEAMRG